MGVLFAAYNGVAALAALLIPAIARLTGRRASHALNLCCGALGLIAFLAIDDPALLWIPMIGVGFAWASISVDAVLDPRGRAAGPENGRLYGRLQSVHRHSAIACSDHSGLAAHDVFRRTGDLRAGVGRMFVPARRARGFRRTRSRRRRAHRRLCRMERPRPAPPVECTQPVCSRRGRSN